MALLSLWLLIVACCAGSTWLVVVWFLRRDQMAPVFIVFLGLTAIGATAGITGGLSREGAVGDIIAAAMGLMGGVVIWLFAADQSKGTIVSASAFVFSLALFLGYFEAANRRATPESYLFWRETCVEKFLDAKVIADPTTFLLISDSVGALCGQIFNKEKELLIDGTKRPVPQMNQRPRSR